mgnify:CR=1 FL=1|jgi:phage shock protein C
MTEKTLHRSKTNKILGGVCGGIAEYLGIPAWVVRLVWIILTIVPVPLVISLLVYILMWAFVPEGPDSLDPNVIDAEFKVKE